MSHIIIENYKVNTALPIDTRFTANNEVDRLAMEFLYDGIIVYQKDNREYYKYTNSTWETFLPQSSGGGVDLSNVEIGYIPFKSASNILVTSSFKLTAGPSNIFGANIKTQRYSVNTNNLYGTFTIGSSDSTPLDKTLSIHQSNSASFIGKNHNFLTDSPIVQSESTSFIQMDDSFSILYKPANGVLNKTYTIDGTRVSTSIEEIYNKFNININNISISQKNITSINENVYRDTNLNNATIIESASYDSSGLVTSLSKLYYKGPGYSVQSTYQNFIISETYDLVNGQSIKRFNDTQVAMYSRSGLWIEGSGSEYSLRVSNANVSRNIIKISPRSSFTSNSFGPGLIVNVNKPSINGFYIGQYYNDNSMRIVREDLMSSNEYYFTFEQDKSIKATITLASDNDRLITLGSDNKLRVKTLTDYMIENTYLATVSKNGTITPTQFQNINKIPQIEADLANVVGATGTVTSVNASVVGNALNVTGNPITTSGTLAFTWGGSVGQYVRGDGSLATMPSGTGTITGVSMSIPSGNAISISPQSVIGGGANFTVNYNGNSTQYINGQGNLATFVDTDTITRIGVNGSGYTSGDINLIAGTNITISKSANNITINSSAASSNITTRNYDFTNGSVHDGFSSPQPIINFNSAIGTKVVAYDMFNDEWNRVFNPINGVLETYGFGPIGVISSNNDVVIKGTVITGNDYSTQYNDQKIYLCLVYRIISGAIDTCNVDFYTLQGLTQLRFNGNVAEERYQSIIIAVVIDNSTLFVNQREI